MLLGGVMLTACAGSDPQFLTVFLVALFVLGLGKLHFKRFWIR